MNHYSKYILIFIVFVLMHINNICAQENDTSVFIIESWKYNLESTEKEHVFMDTNVYAVQLYNPLKQYGSTFIYLGNLGSAGVSNEYAERWNKDFVFGNGYVPYLYNENTYYTYKTKRPFTLVQFNIGDKKTNQEQVIDILHTQNINKELNAGFNVKNISSIGQYPSQKVQITNLGLFGSYIADKMNFHVAINRNIIINQENGGVIDSVFEDENKTNLKGINIYPTDNNPASKFRNRNFQILSEYKIWSSYERDSLNKRNENSFSLGQLITYQDNYRNFTSVNFDSTLYDYYYIDSKNTSDSAYMREWNHKLYFKLKGGNQYIRGGICNEFYQYSYKIIPDTNFIFSADSDIIIYNQNGIKKSTGKGLYNTSIWADIELNISKFFKLAFGSNYYILGYQQNMLKLYGKMVFTTKYFNFNYLSHFKSTKPDYFYNHYISNYYYWQNDFNNSKEWKNEINLYDSKKMRGIKLNHSILYNELYFNKEAYPAQYKGFINIASAKIFAAFNFGPFRTVNEFAVQNSSVDSVLPLPKMSLYHSLCFNQKIFDKVMQLSIGYDLYYYTRYKANAFMPVTGVFYNQQDIQTGSYPFADVYINFKVKRTLFFFKYEHITESFFGKEYYTTPHYPSPAAVLRFGITWMFLN